MTRNRDGERESSSGTMNRKTSQQAYIQLTGSFVSEHKSRDYGPASEILALAILYAIWQTLKGDRDFSKSVYTIKRAIIAENIYTFSPSRRSALSGVSHQITRLKGTILGQAETGAPRELDVNTAGLDVDVLTFLRLCKEELWSEAIEHFHGPLLENWDCQWKQCDWFQDLQDELVIKYLDCHPPTSEAVTDCIKKLRLSGARHIDRLIDEMRNRNCQAEGVAACQMVCDNLYRSGDSPPTFERRTTCDAMRRSVGGDKLPLCSFATAKPRNNCPVLPDRFLIRRQPLLDRIKSLVRNNQLVTVTGSPGIGKTTIVMEIARELADTNAYVHGVWFVSLNDAMDYDQLVQRVLLVYKPALRPQADQTQFAALLEGWRNKQLLVVLDSCEHVIDYVRTFIAALLPANPDIHILAASRDRVDCDYEVPFHIPPLDLPPRSEPITIHELANIPSTCLFIERSKLRVSGRVSTGVTTAIAEICRRLDGNPLAIEVVASQIQSLKITEFVSRLNDIIQSLKDNGGGLEHPTLYAAVKASYDLLTAKEKHVFERLAIFADGWTFDAAMSVIADRDVKEDDVPNFLNALGRKSLVEVVNGRMRMLDFVKAFARNQLKESGDFGVIEQRYSEHFAEFAFTCNRDSWHHITALDPIEVELANVFDVIGICRRERFATNLEIKIVGSLDRYYDIRGSIVQGMELLDASRLRSTGTKPDAFLLGSLLTGLGYLHLRRWRREGLQTCRRFYRQAQELAIFADHPGLINKCDSDLLSFAVNFDDLTVDDLEKLQAAASGSKLHARAVVEHKRRNLAEAERLFRLTLASYETDIPSVALAEGHLSTIIFDRLASEPSSSVMEREDRVTEANGLYADSMRRRSISSLVDISLGFSQRIDWLIPAAYLKEAARLYGAIYSIDEQRHNPHNQLLPFYASLIERRADILLLASFDVGRESRLEDNVDFAIDCGRLLDTYFMGTGQTRTRGNRKAKDQSVG